MRQLPAARTALVVAPHPDDEAIGAWGLMTALRRRSTDVRVLVVSDGGASHPGSTVWPQARLVLERRRETRRALGVLGISPARIGFLGLPDGKLDRADVAGCLAHALGRLPALDLIIGPVEEDDHPDHRAVAQALRTHRRCKQLGYQVWPLGACTSGQLRLPLDARTRAAKRRAILSYRTQAGRVSDSVSGMAITHRHLAAFVRPAEHFSVLA